MYAFAERTTKSPRMNARSANVLRTIFENKNIWEHGSIWNLRDADYQLDEQIDRKGLLKQYRKDGRREEAMGIIIFTSYSTLQNVLQIYYIFSGV